MCQHNVIDDALFKFPRLEIWAPTDNFSMDIRVPPNYLQDFRGHFNICWINCEQTRLDVQQCSTFQLSRRSFPDRSETPILHSCIHCSFHSKLPNLKIQFPYLSQKQLTGFNFSSFASMDKIIWPRFDFRFVTVGEKLPDLVPISSNPPTKNAKCEADSSYEYLKIHKNTPHSLRELPVTKCWKKARNSQNP